MTIDRDDPEGLRRRPENDEVSLAEWVCNVAGGALLRDGLPPSVVGMILQEALEDYARVRTSVKSPRRFLLERVLFKAELRRRLRGMQPPSDPDAGPYLLHVVHTQAALATLAPPAREAVEMLFREGRSYEEIAGTLGLSVGDVCRLVSRSMKRLRRWRPGPPEE